MQAAQGLLCVTSAQEQQACQPPPAVLCTEIVARVQAARMQLEGFGLDVLMLVKEACDTALEKLEGNMEAMLMRATNMLSTLDASRSLTRPADSAGMTGGAAAGGNRGQSSNMQWPDLMTSEVSSWGIWQAWQAGSMTCHTDWLGSDR